MENQLISAKFDAWTKGLNPLAARISVYENIRNIPYAIVPALRDPLTGSAGLLELNKRKISL